VAPDGLADADDAVGEPAEREADESEVDDIADVPDCRYAGERRGRPGAQERGGGVRVNDVRVLPFLRFCSELEMP
jgi:hypothetical protein